MKYYTDEATRKKIDRRLVKNMQIECRLGIDSTPKERLRAKEKQGMLFQQIKDLDEDFFNVIVFDEEKNISP